MTDISELDFHDFHLQELPRRLAAGHGQLAAVAARELPAICFRIKDTDNAYTLQPQPDTIAIVAGTEAETVVELDDSEWQGLIRGGPIPAVLGDADLSIRWESVLKAMVYGEDVIPAPHRHSRPPRHPREGGNPML